MLSHNHLKDFKEDSTLTLYLDKQSVEHYTELQLPRFKLIKEMAKNVNSLDQFVPFIQERDQMNRLRGKSPLMQSILKKILQTPKVGISKRETSLVSKQNSVQKIQTKQTELSQSPDQHWAYNHNFVYPVKRKLSKMEHKINLYQPNFSDNSTSVERLRDVSSLHIKKYNHTKPDESSINSIISKQKILRLKKQKIAKNVQDNLQESKILKVPPSVLQPYMEKAYQLIKDDLYFKVDNSYKVSNEFHEKFSSLKSRYIKFKRHLREQEEYRSPEAIEELQKAARFVIQKNS